MNIVERKQYNNPKLNSYLENLELLQVKLNSHINTVTNLENQRLAEEKIIFELMEEKNKLVNTVCQELHKLGHE